jgi:hypothetical protein
MGLFSKTKGIGTWHIGCLKGKYDSIPRIKTYLTHRKHSYMIQLTKVEISLSKSKRILKIRSFVIRRLATIIMSLQTAFQVGWRSNFSSTTLKTHKIHFMGLISNTKGIGTLLIGCLIGKYVAIPKIKPYLMHRKHSNMIQLTKVVISFLKSKTITEH